MKLYVLLNKDTINTASRMESCGVAGRVHISRATFERVYDIGMEFEERQVEVKGKGMMQSYLLHSKHHDDPCVSYQDTYVAVTATMSTANTINELVSVRDSDSSTEKQTEL